MKNVFKNAAPASPQRPSKELIKFCGFDRKVKTYNETLRILRGEDPYDQSYVGREGVVEFTVAYARVQF